MREAYLDTSLFIELKFQGSPAATKRLIQKHDLYSSELLLAEVLAFAKRESIAEELLSDSLKGISWVLPEGSLAAELKHVAGTGYVRGADLWHLACALYLSPNPADLVFLTLDKRQREAAATLGFQTPVLTKR